MQEIQKKNILNVYEDCSLLSNKFNDRCWREYVKEVCPSMKEWNSGERTVKNGKIASAGK